MRWPNAVMGLLAEYKIKMPAVTDSVVTADDALADRLFEAGFVWPSDSARSA
jgi:hypothetical protein